MSTDTPTLEVAPRSDLGSRVTRRKRRQGVVPGVVYGGDSQPVSVEVDESVLRAVMAAQSALIEMKLDGGDVQPVLIKEFQRHPVTGRVTHFDLVRVRLDVKVQASVGLELEGAEAAPGIRFGGILEQILRDVVIEALPNEIPEVVTLDVSNMEIGDSIFVESIVPPEGVEIISDPSAIVASVSASRVSQQTERSEEAGETEVVGQSASADAGSDGGEE